MVKELSREYKMTLFSVFNRGKKRGRGELNYSHKEDGQRAFERI